MNNHWTVEMWQKSTFVPEPATVQIASAGYRNWWWHIAHGDHQRKVQACVLRDASLCKHSITGYGTTTCLSPKDHRWATPKGLYWEDCHTLDLTRDGFFLQGEKVKGGLYLIFHHLGVDIVKPTFTQSQAELSYNKE